MSALLNAHSSPLSLVSTSTYSATEYLEYLFDYTVTELASDIHLEPCATGLQIRIRQDGILHTFPAPLPELSNAITTRIKVLAGLDIGEKRLPQEGELSYQLASSHAISLRVSTCPTLYGEKIVLRLFNSADQAPTLLSLGLIEIQLALVEKALKQPQGLILVTGPTGCGKNTTLSSCLASLNTGQYNIMTAEDPVEIKLPGLQQVNIKPALGFTFAHALRTFLRQDPDIIMLGEIRDSETATVALQAAQTGHLILSTLHTGDCLRGISRLGMLGIDTSILADNLLLLVAQRLVRKLCQNCRGNTCSSCHDGFRGRIGIFEVLPISFTMQELIRTQVSLSLMQQQAELECFFSMGDHAKYLIDKGITTVEEVERVLGVL